LTHSNQIRLKIETPSAAASNTGVGVTNENSRLMAGTKSTPHSMAIVPTAIQPNCRLEALLLCQVL